MTVALNTPSVLEYVGTNTASVFSITFPTYELESVEASVSDSIGNTTDLVYGVDYTLSNVGIANTNGSLTLVNNGKEWLSSGKLKSGYYLYIKFSANTYQPAKFRDLGRFSPEQMEKSIDRLAMAIKAVNEKVKNALRLQLGDDGDASLPPLTGNANKIVKVNAAATGFDYGIDYQEILDARDEANNAANGAESYKDIAVTKATESASHATDSLNYRNQANTAATNAEAAKVSAQTAASGAAASQSAAALSSIQANNAKVDAELARDTAVAAANDTTIVGLYKEQTEEARDITLSYRNDTLGFANDANTSKNAAASSASAANTSKIAAEAAKVAAQTAQTEAELARDEAELSEQQSELWSNRLLYERIVPIDHSMSPFTINDDVYQETHFVVDTSGGNVVINLPKVSNTFDWVNWKAGFTKKTSDTNKIILTAFSGDTVNMNPTLDVTNPSLGAVLYANSPTDWKAKFFTSMAIAADALPPGGVKGDILVKKSSAFSDVEWQSDKSIINALIFG